MFTIGDFAALGRISVRMLRHYDSLGLLAPARVDPFTGYRFYTADQLSRLNRLLALKDLGFTLEQVGAVLDAKIDPAEFQGMLRLRRAELEERVAADTARLNRVAARLRRIESEGLMSTEDVVLKPVAALRVAVLSAIAESYAPEHIGPALTPLYPELMARLGKASVNFSGPGIAYYLPSADDTVAVHAAFPVTVEPSHAYDFEIVDLPAMASAAAVIHHGSMDNADHSGQILARWIEDNGYRTVDPGYPREVYLECPHDNHDAWVTEFQVGVVPAS